MVKNKTLSRQRDKHDKATESQQQKKPPASCSTPKKPHSSWHVTSQVEQHLFPAAAAAVAEEETTSEDGSISAATFPLSLFRINNAVISVTSTHRIPGSRCHACTAAADTTKAAAAHDYSWEADRR